MMKSVLLTAVVAACIAAGPVSAGDKDPITGEAWERLVAAQDTTLQNRLSEAFAELAGYAVSGPLDAGFRGGVDVDSLFWPVRVLCVTPEIQSRATRALDQRLRTTSVRKVADLKNYGGGALHGTVYEITLDGREVRLLVLTQQANRWLIWYRRVCRQHVADPRTAAFSRYASAVAAYLDSVDAAVPSPVPSTSSVIRVWSEQDQGESPDPVAYGLPAEAALVPPRPDYVIDGYQNYKDLLHEHEDIETWFADGIVAFVPTDSLLDVLKRDAPQAAWPNKEAPLLQHELEKYFKRRGQLYEITTLTRPGLVTLAPGEYFYAVGLNGKIRFAYETPREEVERIEKETGRRIPRANHAFLFPGEPVLTAGAFFVGDGPDRRIVEVNTHSGHYFYSNVTPSIREDISLRSDEYLLTIGHFFEALDREGISYHGILVSKM